MLPVGVMVNFTEPEMELVEVLVSAMVALQLSCWPRRTGCGVQAILVEVPSGVTTKLKERMGSELSAVVPVGAPASARGGYSPEIIVYLVPLVAVNAAPA